MPVAPQLAELVTRNSRTAPRTILGFVWAVLGLLATGAVVVSLALIGRGEVSAACGVLAVPALACLAMLRTVLQRSDTNPEGLMLGQVTGSEYARIRRVTQGDSSLGEVVRAGPPVITDTEAEVLEAEAAAVPTLEGGITP